MAPPIWRWRLFLFWLVAVTVTAVIGCLTPLFETLGYEFSLLISLVSSMGAGHLASCYPHRVRVQKARYPGARRPALVLFYRSLLFSAALLALPYALAFANSLRVEPCNDIEGTYFYLLMPVCSVILACATGLFVGLLVRSAWLASILWFLIFMGTVAQAFWTFYDTPVVYLFGPFFGFFPGALYDKLIQVELRFVYFRIGSLLQAGTLVAASVCLIDPTKLGLSIKRIKSRRTAAMVTLVLAAGSVAMYLAGPSLRHRTDREGLEAILDHHVARGKLDLFFPSKTDAVLAEMLAQDAEFSLHQVEKYLDVEADGRIAVFFFRSRGQKARAMGARRTNIAKPWRGEVYVIIQPLPHTVLRHELAHAVAAKLGKGPFAVPGAFGGLVPNPGLIEGLATAAQGPKTDLTIHQWAAAMKKLKMLPRLKKIFGVAFYDLPASRAYTAAGSFSDWIRQNYGAKALTKAYQNGDWKAATGKSLRHLEKRWRKYLTTVSAQPEDIAVAKHRFDRPAVIHSICVHEVARLQKEANRFAKKKKWEQSFEMHKQAYERSGGSTSAKLKRFFAFVNAGKTSEVRDWANGLVEDREIGSVYRASIVEIVTDLDSRDKNKRQAVAKEYLKLASLARSNSERRRLEVKAHLSVLEGKSIDTILEVLAGRQGPDEVSMKATLLAISMASNKWPDDPVITYMAARQFFNHGDFDTAATEFEKADSQGLDAISNALNLESKMMRAKALFYSKHFQQARDLFAAIAADESRRLGAKAWALDWQDRCEFKLKLM